MTREELLHESVADKFLRYVAVDTRSDEDSRTRPSTPGQTRLAEMLRDELALLGFADVHLDRNGFVRATVPGNKPGAPVVGFLAHLDTFHGMPGRGIRPVLHRSYAGGAIELPSGLRITPEDTPALARMVGHDLITSDGRTLLGADDKAGVAEIMTFACRLAGGAGRPHGDLKLVFTPDEEIGKGVLNFDAAGFGAVCAYTVDGDEAGAFEEENFNALNLKVTINGQNSHPGTARGRMVNAITAAAELAGAVPAGMRPETTDGRMGYMHCEMIEGSPDRVVMLWLLRDFDAAELAAKRRLLQESLRLLAGKYPGLKSRIRAVGGYQNMREGIAKDPRISERALEAIRRAGFEPIIKPIRGGTDGARLTQQGLPTPNLFTGGVNFHSRKELVSIPWMEAAVEVLLNLAELWAG